MCTCCRPNSQGGKPARTQRKLEENVWGRGIRTSAPLVPERRSNVDSITYNPDRGATDGSGHPSHLLHFKRSALKSFSASIQFTYVGTSIRSSYEWVDVAGEIGTELHEYKCADQSSAISQIRIAGQSTTNSSRFSRGLDGKFLSGIFDDLIGLSYNRSGAVSSRHPRNIELYFCGHLRITALTPTNRQRSRCLGPP